MDSTDYTLILALVAALCAAFISGWLLFMMVPLHLFLIVTLLNVSFAWFGNLLPWCVIRQRRWLVTPAVNIVTSTCLTLLVCASAVTVDAVVNEEVNASYFASDEFMRRFIAVVGLSMASSLVVFLTHYVFAQEGPAVRRLGRKALRVTWWASQAKVQLCDDLSAVAPAECAICLDRLADLPVDLAVMPPQRSVPAATMNQFGLLRLPCEHTFHSSCADRWIEQEMICPMCRAPFWSLGKCKRICLTHEAGERRRQAERLDVSEVNVELASDAEGGARIASAELLELPLEFIMRQQDDDFPTPPPPSIHPLAKLSMSSPQSELGAAESGGLEGAKRLVVSVALPKPSAEDVWIETI